MISSPPMEEHHVRRGVGGASTVRRKQAVLIRTGELPRLHGLKDRRQRCTRGFSTMPAYCASVRCR